MRGDLERLRRGFELGGGFGAFLGGVFSGARLVQCHLRALAGCDPEPVVGARVAAVELDGAPPGLLGCFAVTAPEAHDTQVHPRDRITRFARQAGERALGTAQLAALEAGARQDGG